MLPYIRGEPCAIVVHRDLDLRIPNIGADDDVRLGRGPARVEGIEDEIQYHLLKLDRVTEDDRGIGTER